MLNRLFGGKSKEPEEKSQIKTEPASQAKKVEYQVRNFLEMYERGHGSQEDIIPALCGVSYFVLQELQQVKTDYSQLVLLYNNMRQNNEAIVKENRALRQQVEGLSKTIAGQQQQITILKQNSNFVSKDNLQREMGVVNENFDNAFEEIQGLKTTIAQLVNRELLALQNKEVAQEGCTDKVNVAQPPISQEPKEQLDINNIDQVVAYYRKLKSANAVSKVYGVHHSKIDRLLKAAGIDKQQILTGDLPIAQQKKDNSADDAQEGLRGGF